MIRSAILMASASLTVLAGVSVAAAAAAQPAAQPAQTAVEEIVVTAQKRVQNLQDVPIVVTAVSERQLKAAGVRDIKDLTVLAPGLTVTSTTSESSTTARIRGVGTVGDNPGLESSVGIVIDGVYRPRNGVSFGDLGDVSRIEVLKGPQSTLFGKSTSAGVINIITALPSFTYGGDMELTFGNYNAFGAAASVTGPLIGDTLAGSLYVSSRRRDGFNSVVTGAGPRSASEDADQNFYTIRAQALSKPTEQLTFRLIGDFTKRDENCCGAEQIQVGSSPLSRAALVNATRPGSVSMSPDPYARVEYSNRDASNKVEDKGVSLQADADLGWGTLTSITAWRSWESRRGQDADFTAADIYYRPTDQYNDKFDTFSEEARLAGQHGPLNWMVGGFYSNERYAGESPLIYGTDYYSYWALKVLGGAPALIGALPNTTYTPGTGQRDSFRQKDVTWALFTNDTYAITPAWDVTVGLRYTRDKKDLSSVFRTTGDSCARGIAAFPNLVAVVGAQASTIVGGMCLPWETAAFDARSGLQSATESQTSGTVKTSYRFSSDLMAYASYAKGYKAGGFNFDRPASALSLGPTGLVLSISPSTHFAPETVDAWEVGAKTSWFDKSLLLNFAYFDQRYSDFQLNTFLGTSFIVESIPEVTSRGVDADILLRPINTGLTFQGGVTYAKTRYGNFSAGDLTVPARFAGLSRLPGATISFAPEWSVSGSVTYEHALSDRLKGMVNLSGKYMSSYNTGSDLAPEKAQPAYTLLNGRIALSDADDRWSLEAWALNLTDKKYTQVAFNAPLQGTESDPVAIRTYNAFLGAPRTYGVTLRVHY